MTPPLERLLEWHETRKTWRTPTPSLIMPWGTVYRAFTIAPQRRTLCFKNVGIDINSTDSAFVISSISCSANLCTVSTFDMSSITRTVNQCTVSTFDKKIV